MPKTLQIEVEYRFPAGVDASKQAEIIALGQTVGTWGTTFAHRETSFLAHKAEVVDIYTSTEDGSSLATVCFPVANVEGDIASLLTMIFGKYSMAGPAKVTAIRLPKDYGQSPKFGITGMRSHLNTPTRPLVMAIYKPALGLSATDHAQILSQVADAGLNIIKDDEILGNLDSAPTLERLKACRPIIEEAQQKNGRSLLYAVNVTGKANQLLAQAKQLVAAGANALLLNVLSYGFSVLEALAADPEISVPIFAHPALAGAWCGSPDHGFSYSALLGTLFSYAGADAVLYPAHYGSLPFEATEEFRIRDALRSRNVFPVPSAGIHPGVVPRAIADYGQNVILNAGTGIMDHPDGPAAGVKAFFEALELAQPGQSFEISQIAEGPLRRALGKWGTSKC
jgi:2,3-diketo-5-methylthiopentyl-1-phosphate enolase